MGDFAGLTIETSVRAGQPVLVPVVTVNVETAEAIHAFQFLETIQWHFACSSHELKKLGTFFLFERANCTPEPLNLWRRCRIVVIFRIGLPIVDIDVWKTGDE